MNRRVVTTVAGLALLAGFGLALSADLSESPNTPEASPIALVRAAAVAGPDAVHASPSPASGLGHAVPPDPDVLRGAPGRQAIYDAEAKPGEFVTPPNISIEH